MRTGSVSRFCRWIGPVHHIGQPKCWYVIKDNGKYLARSSVVAVNDLIKDTTELKDQMDKFMETLQSKIGNHTIPLFDTTNPKKIYYTPFYSTIEEDLEKLSYGTNLVD